MYVPTNPSRNAFGMSLRRYLLLDICFNDISYREIWGTQFAPGLVPFGSECRPRIRPRFRGGLLVSPPRVLHDIFWNRMTLDDVLFAVIVAGIGLCAAHFRGEYIRWREHRVAERRMETNMRQLQIHTMSLQEGADSIRHVDDFETLAGQESSAERER
jgi:hypothetical protein